MEHNTSSVLPERNPAATSPRTSEKSARHTPGEWKIATHLDEPTTVYVEQADGNEPGICTTDGSEFTPVDSHEEQIANARLIAASPKLLIALSKCDTAFVAWQVGQIPGRPEDILALITEVRAAIAKAERGQ